MQWQRHFSAQRLHYSARPTVQLISYRPESLQVSRGVDIIVETISFWEFTQLPYWQVIDRPTFFLDFIKAEMQAVIQILNVFDRQIVGRLLATVQPNDIPIFQPCMRFFDLLTSKNHLISLTVQRGYCHRQILLLHSINHHIQYLCWLFIGCDDFAPKIVNHIGGGISTMT